MMRMKIGRYRTEAVKNVQVWKPPSHTATHESLLMPPQHAHARRHTPLHARVRNLCAIEGAAQPWKYYIAWATVQVIKCSASRCTQTLSCVVAIIEYVLSTTWMREALRRHP